jgi:hypothetical protein
VEALTQFKGTAKKKNISTVMFWYIHPMNVEAILFYNFIYNFEDKQQQ